jgi:hypothetical protein
VKCGSSHETTNAGSFVVPVLSENCAHRFSPSLLCGRPVVKVQHAAQALPATNHTVAIGSLQGLNELVPDALMIPLRVIVRHELRHGAPKVALAKEQYAVQALLFDRSHEPLCVGITVRRAHCCPDDPDALPFKEPTTARLLCLANIAAVQEPLTLVSPIATLRAMRDVSRRCAAVRSASSTRGDLLLESLALRHQLSVLARSNRRFRPSDRLFWLLLRWLWPRWREALVLVQPATIDRWHRDGFRQCWRRSRRPGRPRIDSLWRDLIRRLAAQNCLWGAPRIHGELLKLGIAVSERTVSLYLRGRPTTRSQTWRTFLANHLGHETFSSLRMSSDPDGDNVVVDGLSPVVPASAVVTRCVVRLHALAACGLASFAPTRVSWRTPRSRSRSRPDRHAKTQRPGPAGQLRLQLASRRTGRNSFVRAAAATEGSVRPLAPPRDRHRQF